MIVRNRIFMIRRQAGFILFVALLTLLIMSMAAIAMMRSIAAGTSVSTNFMLRQQAMASVDAGLESATQWMFANQEYLDLNAYTSISGTGAYYWPVGPNYTVSSTLSTKASVTPLANVQVNWYIPPGQSFLTAGGLTVSSPFDTSTSVNRVNSVGVNGDTVYWEVYKLCDQAPTAIPIPGRGVLASSDQQWSDWI